MYFNCLEELTNIIIRGVTIIYAFVLLSLFPFFPFGKPVGLYQEGGTLKKGAGSPVLEEESSHVRKNNSF